MSNGGGKSRIYRALYKLYGIITHNEISPNTKIGGGLYLTHPFNITINNDAVIGENVFLSKGVTIGQENRGVRKGVPTIGNKVWIGMNATIVGNIKIGDDVLIASNAYVNCDVPSHSVVLGNPCVVKHKEDATRGYVVPYDSELWHKWQDGNLLDYL